LSFSLPFLNAQSSITGAVNKKGEVVIPFIYNNIGTFEKGIAWAQKDGKYGMIDIAGKTIIPFQYEAIYQWSSVNETFIEGVAGVKKNNAYGYINSKNETIIPFEYEMASKFQNGIAWVKKDGLYGCIDKKNNVVIPFQYKMNQSPKFIHGVAKVGNGSKYGVIDEQGNTLLPLSYPFNKLDWMHSGFYENLARFRDGEKFGFKNTKGEVVIPAQYKTAGFFNEGMAVVQEENQFHFINPKGKKVISNLQYDKVDSFDRGIAQVKKNGKLGFINKSGKEIIPCIYKQSKRSESDLILVVNDAGKWGYIDNRNNIKVPMEYSFLGRFSDGLAMFEKNGKFGAVDRNGNNVVPEEYDLIESFQKGYAKVKKGKFFGFIDKQGKVVIPFKYERSPNAIIREGLTWISKEGKMGCVNLKNEVVIPFVFDYAGWFNEHGFAIGRLSNPSLLKMPPKTKVENKPPRKQLELFYDSHQTTDGTLSITYSIKNISTDPATILLPRKEAFHTLEMLEYVRPEFFKLKVTPENGIHHSAPSSPPPGYFPKSKDVIDFVTIPGGAEHKFILKFPKYQSQLSSKDSNIEISLGYNFDDRYLDKKFWNQLKKSTRMSDKEAAEVYELLLNSYRLSMTSRPFKL